MCVCVFQVETIGDAYMVVAGAPEKTKYHAHNICDMALDMVRSIDHLKDPSNGNNIQIRVGVWSPDLFAILSCLVETDLQGTEVGTAVRFTNYSSTS